MSTSDTIDIEKENQRTYRLALARSIIVGAVASIIVIMATVSRCAALKTEATSGITCVSHDLEKVCNKSRAFDHVSCVDLIHDDRFEDSMMECAK